MNSIVVRCSFCPTRHSIAIEEIDTWFARCDCGACGFIEEDRELAENRCDSPGFTVRNALAGDGRPILLSDPQAVFVDEWARRWYASWYFPTGEKPDGAGGVWETRTRDDDTHLQ